jgi:hypothetical protein
MAWSKGPMESKQMAIDNYTGYKCKCPNCNWEVYSSRRAFHVNGCASCCADILEGNAGIHCVSSTFCLCFHLLLWSQSGWNALWHRSSGSCLSSEHRAKWWRCGAKTGALWHHWAYTNLFTAADCEVMVYMLGACPNACGCRVHIIPLHKDDWAWSFCTRSLVSIKPKVPPVVAAVKV